MKWALILLVVSIQALAQTTSTPLPSTSASNTSVASFDSLSWDKIKSKLKINYFSETLGPSVKKWDDNEIEDDGSKKREPMTMYHSFNVRALTGKQFNLFMSPRFSTAIGDRNDLRANQDDNVFMMDDWQYGIYYSFITTPTFNYAQSLTHRAPYSQKSRNENIASQVEWQHLVNWALRPEIRILHWTNLRYYEFEQEATEERYRINWRTIGNYTINDKWNVQLAYEFDIQHRNNENPDNRKHRDMNYMKRYHSYTSLAVGYSPIQNWTVMPFIRTVDERNIRNETTILGLWVLGKVI